MLNPQPQVTISQLGVPIVWANVAFSVIFAFGLLSTFFYIFLCQLERRSYPSQLASHNANSLTSLLGRGLCATFLPERGAE